VPSGSGQKEWSRGVRWVGGLGPVRSQSHTQFRPRWASSTLSWVCDKEVERVMQVLSRRTKNNPS